MLKQLLVWLGSALLSAAGQSALVRVVDLDHYKIMIVCHKEPTPEALMRMTAQLKDWLKGDKPVCVLGGPITQIVFLKEIRNA